MANILLLTWTITPSQKIENKSAQDLNIENRKKDYIRALVYYITQSDFDNIVFCENSNTDLDEYSIIKELANLFWKKIELLSFQWNTELAEKYWYGAWEAEIFDYVFEKSTLLKNSNSFYKITGRYILKNVNQIIEKTQNYENYFHKQWLFMTQFTASTAFFKISKENYKKYLYKKQLELYSRLDRKEYKNEIFFKNHFPLERVWYCLLRKELLDMNQSISLEVNYEYPKVCTHWVNASFRNLIYKIYCYIRLNQYGIIHKIIDKSLYWITYKNLINDRLI